MSNDVFRSPRSSRQYMSDRERKNLIRDYIWARDSYRKAIADERRAYEALLRRGLIPDQDRKSDP